MSLKAYLKEVRARAEKATPLGEDCPEKMYLFRKDMGGAVAEIRALHNKHTAEWRDEGHNYDFLRNARVDVEKLLRIIEKQVEALETIGLSPSVERYVDHASWGNADDSFSHGYDCGAGYCGKMAREAIEQANLIAEEKNG